MVQERPVMQGRLVSYYFPAPVDTIDQQQAKEFDEIFASVLSRGANNLIPYSSAYPKHAFLRYLVTDKRCLLHGSRESEIAILEPWSPASCPDSGQSAVFAASDGILPIFFAMADRGEHNTVQNMRCLMVSTDGGTARKFYHLLLSAHVPETRPWESGTVYILPRDCFMPYVGAGAPSSEEWISQQPVRPLARLPVTPRDFPFLDDLVGPKRPRLSAESASQRRSLSPPNASHVGEDALRVHAARVSGRLVPRGPFDNLPSLWLNV
jgi:hypothetical protein